MRYLVCVLFYMVAGSAQAKVFEPSPSFEPTAWEKGLHIFAGLGVNVSSFKSDDQASTPGVGSNFKTDVGWYFNENWAYESSASIRFTRRDEFLLWDSLFTLGVRYRLQDPLWGYEGNFVRGFLGSAPTVAFPEGYRLASSEGLRHHFQGPVIGAGIGHLEKRDSDLVWFVEANVSAQALKTMSDIRMDGEVPVVERKTTLTNNSTIYSFFVTAGMMMF